MSSSDESKQAEQPQLSLWDAISIIVGIIIGAGIYETPPGIFRMMPDAWVTFGVWAGCGLLALIGALCYAELATTYPRSGGDYVYLTRAYGPFVGYLFGWTQLAVIQTGSIGLMAYVFGDYAARLFGLHGDAAVFFAVGAVVLMTLLNIIGVKFGAVTQNILTGVKVLGLLGIIIVGFAFAKNDRDAVSGVVTAVGDNKISVTIDGAPREFTVGKETEIIVNHRKTFKNEKTKEDEPFTLKNFEVDKPVRIVTSKVNPTDVLQVRSGSSGLAFGALTFAMVLVLLTYGGWNDAAFVAAEVRNPQRNIPLALILGTLGVMVIYMVINFAYVNALTLEGAQDSREIAADMLKLAPWGFGEQAMCILVMISALGAVNGLIFTSSRIYSTLGADYSLFVLLSKKNGSTGAPIASLVLQMVITLLMVLAVGTSFGHDRLNDALVYLGQDRAEDLGGQGGFNLLLRCTAPIFWIFFLMTAFALFVLRINDRTATRPFPVPLFPILPLIFCATCAYMTYSGVNYAGRLGFVGAVLVFAGLPFYVFSRHTGLPEKNAQGDVIP